MKMHLGFARTDFSRRHSTQEPSLAAIAGSGPQDDIFVAANARGLPLATAFRGFYGVLKCSPGAKSHAEIAALVRDEAAARRPPQARSKLIWDASSVPRW